jgi:hypothetical protein
MLSLPTTTPTETRVNDESGWEAPWRVCEHPRERPARLDKTNAASPRRNWHGTITQDAMATDRDGFALPEGALRPCSCPHDRAFDRPLPLMHWRLRVDTA